MTRKRAKALATNASGLTLAQWIHAAAFAQGHGLGPGDFREARRDWEADVDPAEWGRPRRPSKRHHATKKSSTTARLDREVHRALVLSLKPGAKVIANGYPGSVVRVTPYNMIEVRLPGGVAAVSAEDVTIPGVSQGNYHP